jgi:hypothetical protein
MKTTNQMRRLQAEIDRLEGLAANTPRRSPALPQYRRQISRYRAQLDALRTRDLDDCLMQAGIDPLTNQPA